MPIAASLTSCRPAECQQPQAHRVGAVQDNEGWPAARFLETLAEHETPDRRRRRIERHLAIGGRQTFETFDFSPCSCSARRRSGRLPAGAAGLIKVPISCSFAGRRGQKPSCRSTRSEGSALLAGGDQLEQDTGLALSLGDVGDISRISNLVLVELGDGRFKPTLPARPPAAGRARWCV